MTFCRKDKQWQKSRTGMRACIRTHQSLYERHFGVTLSAANTGAFLSHCAASGATGSVLAKGGEPILKDSVCIPVEPSTTAPGSDGKGTTVIVTPCETVDEWTYNPGSGQFYTTLRFERGTLKSMKYGARVP